MQRFCFFETMKKVDVSTFDAIIFDLGGVILNIDYNATADAFRELGFDNFDEVYSQAKQSNLFDDLETGRISPQQFRERVREFGKIELTDEQIDQAWNAMLLDLPEHRIDLLDQLAGSKRIFLLSNTNQIHYDQYQKSLIDRFGSDVLNERFERSFFSHQIGKRKPHPETFEWVCAEISAAPGATLFIDDSIQHIEGANRAGLRTLHKPGDIDVAEVLNVD